MSRSAATLEAMHLGFDRWLRAADEAEVARSRLVEDAYHHHLERNPVYRAYARAVLGRDPACAVLSEIPLLPSSLFKRADLRTSSVPDSAIAKLCVSSGTLGSRSVVPRDDDTLSQFLSSISAALPSLLGLDRLGDHHGIVLGPTTEDAGDSWFSYVIACVTVMMKTDCFERGGVFLADAAALRILETIEQGRAPLVVGPPFRILEIAERLERVASRPPFPKGGYVVSAGGFKGRDDRAVAPSEFRSRVARAFKMESPASVRDCFNMVELNSVVLECEAHGKHAPPWLEVQSRDPRTNQVLPDGVEGMLAFLDPSATSYPCFILSEDVGAVHRRRCACGREGLVLEVRRRMQRVEARGCALRMALGSPRPSEDRRFFQSVFRRSGEASEKAR